MLRVIIIAIGNELLIGETLDTNTNWLCRQLTGLGAHVEREFRLTRWERIHKIGEELRGDGDRALILDPRRDPHVDPDLQIGRRQLYPSVLRP